MPGKNYFGLLRKVYSTDKLAAVLGLKVEDVKSTNTKFNFSDDDRIQVALARKYKRVWKQYLKNKKDMGY